MEDIIKAFAGTQDTLETFDLDSLDPTQAYIFVVNYHMEEGAVLWPLKKNGELELDKPLEPISSGVSSTDFLALVAHYAQEHGARIVINDDQGVLIEGSVQACLGIEKDLGDNFQSIIKDSGATKNYIMHLRYQAEEDVGLGLDAWETPKPSHLH